jgi:hypothetical protein
MFKVFVFTASLFFSTHFAFADEIFFGGGLDLQLSDNKLDGGTTYEHPDNRPALGGAIGAYARINMSEGFSLRTGAELVSRQLRQEYDAGLFITSDGRSRYDVVSFDFPIYGELLLGNGNHVLYAGPKLAVKIYDHCSDNVTGTGALACMSGAAKNVFVPFQLGYILKFNGGRTGLTFFIESTLTPVIDQTPLKSNLMRTGAQFNFYL